MMLPPTSVLQEQSVVLEAQREAAARRTQLDMDRQEDSDAQRVRREAQIAEDLERDMELEEERIRRNLQIAQYCGCNKCQVGGAYCNYLSFSECGIYS